MYVIYRLEIPFVFKLLQSGLIHGLAFWFDVAFVGSRWEPKIWEERFLRTTCLKGLIIVLLCLFVQDDSMAVHCSKWTFDSLVSGALSSADPPVCQNGTDIIWTGSSNSQQEVRLTLLMHMMRGQREVGLITFLRLEHGSKI